MTLNLDGVVDYVRATIEGVGPAPRIPPFRLLSGIEAQGSRIQARLEAEWTDGQDRVAAFETPTDGYTMINASVSFQPLSNNRNTSITLSANNIFDVEAGRHASFLKDVAPLAGRHIRISARLSFSPARVISPGAAWGGDLSDGRGRRRWRRGHVLGADGGACAGGYIS